MRKLSLITLLLFGISSSFAQQAQSGGDRVGNGGDGRIRQIIDESTMYDLSFCYVEHVSIEEVCRYFFSLPSSGPMSSKEEYFLDQCCDY